jgi:hypothetical protein
MLCFEPLYLKILRLEIRSCHGPEVFNAAHHFAAPCASTFALSSIT